MLTATLDQTGDKINLSDSYIYAKRIRTIPTAEFNKTRKIWQFDIKYLDDFVKQFNGEVYYKTPLWVLRHETPPDYASLYKFETEISLPQMQIPPYDYQNFGAKFMIDRLMKHGFVINADGCGIGKTMQAVQVMQYFSDKYHTHKMLLIVKKSIKEQWASEIERFSRLSSTHEIIVTEDVKKKRLLCYERAKKAKACILITNYENFLNDWELISEMGAGVVIVDEAHCVKAREGKKNANISKVIRGIPTIFLTGTPIMSRPEDIFGIIQMANPEYFGDWMLFRREYLIIQQNYGYESTVGVKNLHKLHEKIQDVVIRRTEYEVAVQMPKTVTHVQKCKCGDIQRQFLVMVRDEEDEMQKTADGYEGLARQRDLSDNEKDLQTININRMKGLISIKQLAADDPKIFQNVSSKMALRYAKKLPSKLAVSSKTESIIELVDDILESGEKVILFSKFVTVGLYYQAILKANLKKEVLMYTGKESSEQRIQNKKLFCETDDYNILIGSDAMAEGLNLAEARHIVNIDLPDTYAIYTQRIGRVRRVSSAYDNIVVHNMITQGTVDEAKYAKIIRDKNLDGALIAVDRAQSEALKAAMNKDS